MTIKTFALVHQEGNGIEVSNNKNVKITDNDKKKEKTYKFDGAAVLKSDELNNLIQPSLNDVATGASASFISFQAENESSKKEASGDADLVGAAAPHFFTADKRNENGDRLVSVSMLNIGDDDTLYDVINPHNRTIEIKHHSKLGLYVDGLSRVVAPSPDDLVRWYLDGMEVVSGLHLTSQALLFTVTVFLSPKNKKDGRIIQSECQFLHINLNNNSEKIKKAMGKVSGGQRASIAKRSSVLELIIDDCVFARDSCAVARVGRDAATSDAAADKQTLEIVENVRGAGSKPGKGAEVDCQLAIDQLRKEIDRAREKIAAQHVPRTDDVDAMEHLLRELDVCKMRCWDETILRSLHFHHERKENFANKGLAWILSKKQQMTKEKISSRQQQVSRAGEEFKQQRQISDKVNLELKTEIENYTQLINAGKSEAKLKDKLSVIQQLKEKSRLESERLRDVKLKLKNERDQLKNDELAGLSESVSAYDVKMTSLQEERDRTREENQKLVDEQLAKMKTEIEHDVADIRAKHSAGGFDNQQQAVDDLVELTRLRAEKSVLTTQLEALRRERQQADEHLRQMAEKHERDTEMQRLHNLQTFRAYREVFEDYKSELENRWRSLLDDAIQDAVFLNSRNHELLQKNADLTREKNKLRDAMSADPKRVTS